MRKVWVIPNFVSVLLPKKWFLPFIPSLNSAPGFETVFSDSRGGANQDRIGLAPVFFDFFFRLDFESN